MPELFDSPDAMSGHQFYPIVAPLRARWRGPQSTLELNTFRNQLLSDLHRLDAILTDMDKAIADRFLGLMYGKDSGDAEALVVANLAGDELAHQPLRSMHRRLMEMSDHLNFLIRADL